ncbi:NfeD family protein [uncultured Ruminococcus sp.]|jgi:membrane protein implicated in regulation of membrane protease activity|uniref:NfeD family protein n=2 Tax=Ruminococcus TaxID=1263 RepID=UPI00266585B9|nr:NfeD family protein [uncultured Ruminococcus sp.]
MKGVFVMEVCAPYFIWGILFVLAVVAEIVSFQLVSIWFAAGALAAFLAACFGGSVMLQIILFLAVSVVLLLFTRPIAKKIFSFGIRDTNTQEIGRTASVIQTIDSRSGTGRVRIDGVDWMAVSATNAVIPEHSYVRVDAVDGSKLIVSPLPQNETAPIHT